VVAAINGLVGGVGLALLVWKLLGSDREVLAIALGAVSTLVFVPVAYTHQVDPHSSAAEADRRRFATPLS
jgi:hypothetical protein